MIQRTSELDVKLSTTEASPTYRRPSGMEEDLFNLVVRALGKYVLPTNHVLDIFLRHKLFTLKGFAELDLVGMTTTPYSLPYQHAIALMEQLDRLPVMVTRELRVDAPPAVFPAQAPTAILPHFEFVNVPDISASELIQRTKQRCRLTSIAYDYERWDFHKSRLNNKPISGRGMTFEVRTWSPGERTVAHYAYEHFKKIGFYGHAAAFTAWIGEQSPQGLHLCLLETFSSWREDDLSRGTAFAPIYQCTSTERLLRFSAIGDIKWPKEAVFVAFRRVEEDSLPSSNG